MQTSRRERQEPESRKPDFERILETALVKRCGVCWVIWPAEDFITEDGQERCPNCVDGAESDRAKTMAGETAYAASRQLRPQVSQAPLRETFPAAIRLITDANGSRVYSGSPMILAKGIATTAILLGRNFTASDTITASTGITVSVVGRTATQTTLSLTAGVSMAAGDHYKLTFNDVDFTNIFVVR